MLDRTGHRPNDNMSHFRVVSDMGRSESTHMLIHVIMASASTELYLPNDVRLAEQKLTPYQLLGRPQCLTWVRIAYTLVKGEDHCTSHPNGAHTASNTLR